MCFLHNWIFYNCVTSLVLPGITNADEFALFIDEEKEFEEEKKIEDAEKQKTNTIRRVVRNKSIKNLILF